MTTYFQSTLRNVIVFSFSLFVVPLLVHAEEVTIALSPSTGTYVVDEDVIVNILASSGGQLSNAVEGQLSYDPKVITVTSTSHEGSLINSWTEEPSVDAENGVISFGGMLATSTMLDHSLILVLHFRPLRAGDVRVHFENGTIVHAADGTGGNILTGFGDGRYSVNPKILSGEFESSSSQGEVLGVSTGTPMVAITSRTHPSQDAWYSASSSIFVFQALPNVTRLRLGFDKKENGEARVIYNSVITEKKIDNLEDGTWYLHLSASDSNARVFETNYRVNIDRTPPENFTVNEVTRTDNTDPNLIFNIHATDTPSGVDHYTFRIDDQEPLDWIDDGGHQFRHTTLLRGTHELTVSVFDKAGNMVSQKHSFEVAYLPSPRLTLLEPSLHEGDVLPLSIDAPANAALDVFLSRNGDATIVEKALAPESGSVNFLSSVVLLPGTYDVWAVATKPDGALSKESKHLLIEVSPSIWGLITRHTLIPPALFALLLLVVISVYLFRKINKQGDQLERTTPLPQVEHWSVDASSAKQVVLRSSRKDVRQHHVLPVRLD